MEKTSKMVKIPVPKIYLGQDCLKLSILVDKMILLIFNVLITHT